VGEVAGVCNRRPLLELEGCGLLLSQTAVKPLNPPLIHPPDPQIHANAVLQFAMVALWLSCVMPRGLCINLGMVGLPQWLATLALFGYGQSLNAGIFAAIGKVGVYYGFKLGHKVPWVNGWPFDSVSHPQYVGSVLSVWALIALVWGQAPTSGLLVLGSYWTALYVVTGVHEQYGN